MGTLAQTLRQFVSARRQARDLVIAAIARLHGCGLQPAHLTALLGLLA
jgi:hypothetical protein